MDFIKNAVSGGGGDNNKSGENSQQNENSQSGGGGGGGGLFGGMGEKLNSAAGGGKESEKNEDLLDKGMCAFLPIFKSKTLSSFLHTLLIPSRSLLLFKFTIRRSISGFMYISPYRICVSCYMQLISVHCLLPCRHRRRAAVRPGSGRPEQRVGV